MSKKKNNLIAVLGPTAVGKTKLGVVLAKEFNGEVVSADSRQVYRGLDIGSDKITPRETKGIPHHLIDVASPRRTFSVANFQKKAYRAIRQISRRGNIPFLVGGSPLYVYSVIDGWVFPEVSPDRNLRKRLASQTTEQLYATLSKMDPEYAEKIDSRNPRRLIRAIEIARHSGKIAPLEKNPLCRTLLLGLALPRSEIKKRIQQRLEDRIDKGLIDEVRKLRSISLSWKRLEGFGLEYRWVALYLQDKITADEMEFGIIKDSLKLVKNQMNWLKKDRRINWVKGADQARKMVRGFLDN